MRDVNFKKYVNKDRGNTKFNINTSIIKLQTFIPIFKNKHLKTTSI